MQHIRHILHGFAFTILMASASAQSPAITSHPSALSVGNGQVAVFKVSATDALTYQWRKNDINLAPTDRISGVTGPILSISPALAEDAGTYTVLVTNAVGNTTGGPATLAMNVSLPVFTLDPVSQTRADGEAVGFLAATSGSEPISFQWMRFGIPVTDDGRISGATTPNLGITALTSADSGWYWLVATNTDGSVSSEPARLTVTTSGDLGASANFPEGTWTTGGTGGTWFTQSGITQDGISAVRSSGTIPFSSSTYIETTIYGPGELSFYWAVSSEPGFDPFACQLDGVELDKISGEQMGWTERKFAVGWGPHVVRWVFSVDHNKPGLYNAAFLDQVAFTPMPVTSLESAGASIPLPLRTSGNAAWFGQTPVSHDGISAARSGYITHNQSTTLETTVCGPGMIAFHWKVSSEYADPLIFLVDGVPLAQIASEEDWTQRSFRIPWGIHTLAWRFQKDGNDSGGARGNAAWIDEVTFNPVTLSNLAEAGDALSPWLSGGNLPFFGQNEFTFDGTDALQSGPITHNQSSNVNSGVTGPGTLTFRWKVSSEDDDYLRFAIDGVEQTRIAADVDWTAKTYVIRPGAHVFDWKYAKDFDVNQGYDAGWVDTVAFVAAPPLPVAVNAPGLAWSMSGNADWFPEMVTTHDGAASARSGDIGHSQSSTMETTVTGPGTVAFWWKTSSEYADPLVFLVDGVERARISGEADWANPTFNLVGGNHTLSWRYQKDHSAALGADAGWVDQITFTGTTTYASWAAERFSPEELAEQAISGPDGNQSHDGICNLLKYAFNMDPHTAYHGTNRVLTPDTGLLGLPGITQTPGGLLRVEYLQRVGINPLIYTVEFSTNLTDGFPDGWIEATNPPTISPTTDPMWCRVVVMDSTPPSATRRFARMVVRESSN